MFWYCFRERDRILDIFEMSTGQRMHTRYFQVGGVFEDIPVGLRREGARLLRGDAGRGSTSTRRCSTATRSSCAARKGRRHRPPRAAARARRHRAAAAGRRRALGPAQGLRLPRLPGLRLQDPGRHGRRRLRPLPGAAAGDARVGADRRAGDRRPARRGRSSPTTARYVLPPRDELATSMEALIHHFKLVTEGFRVPPGELYYAIEGPRGELGCFVVADGSAKPARVHFRDPSFVNLQALRDMSRRRLRRRPDPEPGDARSDPRGHRPVSPLCPRADPEDAGRSGSTRARPRRARLEPDPTVSIAAVEALARPRARARPGAGPGPRRGRGAAGAAARDRAGDEALPREALGLDPGAVGGAAPLRLVHARGDPPGGRGDGRHPRPTSSRSRASTTSSTSSPQGEHQVLVCTNISCWLRGGRRPARRVSRRRGRARRTRGRQGLRQGLRVPRRLRHRADGLDRRALLRAARATATPRRRSSSCARGDEVLPDKRLEDRERRRAAASAGRQAHHQAPAEQAEAAEDRAKAASK